MIIFVSVVDKLIIYSVSEYLAATRYVVRLDRRDEALLYEGYGSVEGFTSW